MRWPWGSEFNKDQRKETAKLLLGGCQIIFIALVGSSFVPQLGEIEWFERIYGIIILVLLYTIAMRLLKDV